MDATAPDRTRPVTRIPGAAVLLALLLGSAACGGDRVDDAPPSSVDGAAAAGEQAAEGVAVGEPDAAATGAAVALDGEGLRIVDTATGSARLLPFGAEAQVVEDALVRLWGDPAQRVELPDCGPGPPVAIGWDNGFVALMRESRFASWSAGAAAMPGRVSTMTGMAVGSPRDQVESAYDIDVRESSLGVEFDAGGITGVFDGDGAEARVTALWAGEACIFR